MSSWIGVYGHNGTEVTWMRRNYKTADAMFREIHPVFNSEDGRFEHGIDEKVSSFFLNITNLFMSFKFYVYQKVYK